MKDSPAEDPITRQPENWPRVPGRIPPAEKPHGVMRLAARVHHERPGEESEKK